MRAPHSSVPEQVMSRLNPKPAAVATHNHTRFGTDDHSVQSSMQNLEREGIELQEDLQLEVVDVEHELRLQEIRDFQHDIRMGGISRSCRICRRDLRHTVCIECGAKLTGPDPDEVFDHINRNIMDLNMGLDIGHWGSHEGTVGVEFLQGHPATTQDCHRIREAFQVASHADNFLCFPEVELLDASQRSMLMALADRHHTGERDFKWELTLSELRRHVGANTVAQLQALFGVDVSKVKLRRTEARNGGACINFHTDVALKTLQVPLNDESEYEGGRLVYCSAEGMVWPSRRAGSATVHNNTIPHGVSAHKVGVRYGLFLLQDPA